MSDDEDGYRTSFGGGGLGFRHAAAEDASEDDQRLSLGGGMSFRTPGPYTGSADPQQDIEDDAPPAKKMKFSKSMGGGMAQDRQIPAAGGGGSGFAARMMAKMGYKEGEGLGADGRGRLAPIDAQLRPQGVGLGAVREKTKQAKEEEKRAAAFRGEEVEDSSEEERKRKREAKKKRQQQALKGIGSSQTQPRTRYRTAAEIETDAGLEIPDVLKSLVDLTGQDTQYAAVAPGVMVPQETEAMKIAKRARRDLEAFAEERNTLKEQKEYAELENEQLVVDLDKQATDMAHMQDIAQAVEELQDLSLQGGAMDVTTEQWKALTVRLESLEDRFKDDITKFGIHEAAVATISPLFKISMLNWTPLQQPEYLVDYLSRLQFMLGARVNPSGTDAVTLRSEEYAPLRANKKSTSQFETMMYTMWLPQVRSAITNEWEVEQSEPLERLLKAWRPILPVFILNHIMGQLIVPRLASALAAWKPGRSTGKSKGRTNSPPHHWLFPWLELLPPSQLDHTAHDGLAAELRRKVRSLLSAHDIATGLPSWLSALRTPLLPESIFSKITTNYLLPRLATHLERNLMINPSDQDVEPLDQVLAFAPLFKAESFAELLVATFFPKFHSILHRWLVSEPNYDEVREWIKWWQQQIPENLRQVSRITRQWKAAFAMVSQARDLSLRSRTKLPTIEAFLGDEDKSPRSTARDRHSERKRQSERNQNSETSKPERAITFRDAIEEFCSDIALLFMPMREAHPTNAAPLLRITASSTAKGGIIGYTQGDLFYKRFKVDSDEIERSEWRPVDWQRELAMMARG